MVNRRCILVLMLSLAGSAHAQSEPQLPTDIVDAELKAGATKSIEDIGVRRHLLTRGMRIAGFLSSSEAFEKPSFSLYTSRAWVRHRGALARAKFEQPTSAQLDVADKAEVIRVFINVDAEQIVFHDERQHTVVRPIRRELSQELVPFLDTGRFAQPPGSLLFVFEEPAVRRLAAGTPNGNLWITAVMPTTSQGLRNVTIRLDGKDLSDLH